MSTVNFGGLATGLDTESIISALMDIERAPIKRLENDKAYYQNRLKAFSTLDEKLNAFLEKAEAIDSRTELNSASVASSSEEYLTASSDSRVQAGSYQLKVLALAQQQKDVSQGYADKTAADFGTGSISLTVAGTAHPISIDTESNSLDGIAQAINDAEVGVTATIINDGTASPYRLVLTGDSVSDNFSLDASGLSGGSGTNPTMTNTQTAQQAHIQLDGIDVYSDSNNVDGAVPGLSIDLLKADATGTATTTLNVSGDNEATTAKIQEFVDAYNDVITFIADQKDSGWGNDSSFRSLKGQIQSLVTSRLGSGNYSSLSQLGFETQRDGQVVVNSTILSSALEDDYDAVIDLFAGSDGADGISKQFADYLDRMTDSVDGLYAGRKKTTDSSLRRIDRRIENLELRMEQREETMRAQFTAMENLVSGLNAQGSYVLQQLATMPTIGGRK